jgi:hypothetical protein
MSPQLKKWTAFGTGVGVEIRESDLEVTIARVRPSGVSVLGAATVSGFRSRPASEWGRELSNFLKQVGAGHVAATVLLPRHEVIVRTIELPGVPDKDLAAAVQFQADSLHPFSEDEAVYSFARIGRTGSVLIGITRREVVDGYAVLFAEAGIKTSSFTFSAAALYAAARIPAGWSGAPEFVAVHHGDSTVEVYGESEARPVFSAAFDRPNERAVALAIAELRLQPDAAPLGIADVLPKPRLYPPSHDPATPEFAEHTLPYATAVSGACPWLGLKANLLPAQYRKTSSRARLVPTFVLGGLLALLLVALALENKLFNERYLDLVQGEVKKLEPTARRADLIDRKIVEVRGRTHMLEEFRRRSKQDLDALGELTRLMEPPAYLSSLELNRETMQMGGETEQAAGMLKLLDESPYFRNTEFTTPINRSPTGEVFRVRASREERPAPPAPPPAAPKAAKEPAE